MSNSQRHNFRRPHQRSNQGHQSRNHGYSRPPGQYHQHPPATGVFPPPPPQYPGQFPEWSHVRFPPPGPPHPDFGPGPPDSHWRAGFQPHAHVPGPGMGPPNPWMEPPPHPHPGYDPHMRNNSFYDPHNGPMDHRRNFNMHESFRELEEGKRRSSYDMFFGANEHEGGGYSKRPRQSDPEIVMRDDHGFHLSNRMDSNPTLLDQSPRGRLQDVQSRSNHHHHHHHRATPLFQNLGRLHAPLRPMVDVNRKLDVPDHHSTTVSILCYNLLAQDLIHKNMYLYDSHEPNVLSWDYRKINLFADLRGAKADILCLQEVQQDHYETWFEPELAQHDFAGLYQCRTGSNNDGCAIFYRKSHLKLIEWTGLKYQKNSKVLNRDNVGIVAKFCPVEGDDSGMFCVTTTHLLYNPKAGEVKLAQISCLLAELHKMAAVPGKKKLLPAILCGDFNSTPNSPFLEFIASSSLDYSNLSAAMIAGYFNDHRKMRVIPIPLLPEHLNIGSNCMYTHIESHKMKQTDVLDSVKSSPSVASNNSVSERSSRESSTIQSSVQVQTKSDVSTLSVGDNVKLTLDHTSIGSQPSLVTSGTEFVAQQNEEFKQVEMPSSYRTRSARGARVRGVIHGGMSGLSRSLGATKDLNTSRDDHSPSNSMEFNEEQINNEQQTPEVNMAVENSVQSSTSVGNTIKDVRQPITKNHKSVSGVLTHPFNFESAYPHLPSSMPSTVTTYHQSAFETVDYIFYTPMVAGSAACTSGFHLLSRKVLPSTHTLLDLGPQPHKFLSSDHLSLQAVFQLVWKQHT